MFHFFLFLLTFCIFHGSKADFTNFETDDAVFNESSSKISYIYIYDESEFENEAEYNSETSDDVTTEEDSNENEENTQNNEEFATSKNEDSVYSSTSSSELETQIEDNIESSEEIASEECTKDSQGNTDNDEDKKCTRPNEMYKADKKTCPLEICPSSKFVISYACNPEEVGKPGCVCKPGFLRISPNSTCIPKEQCPGQGNTTLNCSFLNESATCVKSCPPLRTCENRDKIYECPEMPLNASCTYQCACNDGYYRNSDGFCVTSELCDKKCTRPNEVYKSDKKTCPLEICPSTKFVIRYACNPKEVGQPGCVCKPGFLRISPNSTCIPKEQCPDQDKPLQCTLPNESLKCLKSCPGPRTCDTRDLYYKCANNVNETCKNECVCDDGFYRNRDGFCVTYDLCDKKCPGPNEEYKADKKTCPPEICKSIVSRYACDPKEVGQPGCVCKSGFLRLNLNSTCIPTKECPELANRKCHRSCACICCGKKVFTICTKCDMICLQLLDDTV